MQFNETLTFLMTEVLNQFRTQFESHLNEIGLHSGQVFILLELWNKNGLKQVDLAQKLKVTPPTIHKMVQSLKRNGFIVCAPCKNDARSKLVFLTAKGKRYESSVVDKWKNFEQKFFENINETEKLIIRQILEKINN